MGRMPLRIGVKRVEILYCSSMGGKYDVKKEALG